MFRAPLGEGCGAQGVQFFTPHPSPCPLQTDGASAMLIMSEEKALAMGYKPKAYLR